MALVDDSTTRFTRAIYLFTKTSKMDTYAINSKPTWLVSPKSRPRLQLAKQQLVEGHFLR